MVTKLIQIIFLFSLIIFIFSYVQKNKLPEKVEILNSLQKDPVQTTIIKEPFQIKKKGFTYQIYPKYNYEIYGLIVTEYDSENPIDYIHQTDPLNTRDLCVVWGENINSGIYKYFNFSHGEFTCYINFPNRNVDYSKFTSTQLSNNHLLPKDENIYKKIKEAKVGDQVYIKGYLVDYSNNLPDGSKGGSRLTSIVRDDTGCEIIYVTEFEILKRGNILYRNINDTSKYVAISSLILLLITVFIPPKKSNKIFIRNNFSRYGRFNN